MPVALSLRRKACRLESGLGEQLLLLCRFRQRPFPQSDLLMFETGFPIRDGAGCASAPKDARNRSGLIKLTDSLGLHRWQHCYFGTVDRAIIEIDHVLIEHPNAA